MKQWLFMMVVAVGVLAGTVHAASFKPWQWTPSAANNAIVASSPDVYPSFQHQRVKESRCSGRGRSLQGRFTSFRCLTGFGDKYGGVQLRAVLWAKVRKTGTGSICVSLESLTAIPSGCLATTGQPRALGSLADAYLETRKWMAKTEGLTYIWQGVMSCLGSGAGFYLCTFEERDGNIVLSATATGRGTVIKLVSGTPRTP